MADEEVLACARHGDDEQLRALLRRAKDDAARAALVNYVQPETLNTPLHMGTLAARLVIKGMARNVLLWL
jgi:hypothetical protein